MLHQKSEYVRFRSSDSLGPCKILILKVWGSLILVGWWKRSVGSNL